MSKFIVHKATRSPLSAYGGPTCRRAGVSPNASFDSFEEAQEVATRLSKLNPVGFRVSMVRPTTADVRSSIWRALACVTPLRNAGCRGDAHLSQIEEVLWSALQKLHQHDNEQEEQDRE